MVQLRTYQSNFSGGELSPSMQSRTDVSKYQSGVRLARNFQLKPQGGLRFRNGFEQIGEAIQSDFQSWLTSFVVAEQEAYILEFGDNVLRFIRDGAYVLDSSSEREIGSITAPEGEAPVVTTAEEHEFEDGDRVFLSDIEGGPDVDANFFMVRNPTDTTFELHNRWDEPVERGDMGEVTAGVVAKPYQIETPYRAWEARRLQTTQDQAVMFLLSHDHPPHRLERNDVDDWSLREETFRPTIEPPPTTRVQSTALEVSNRDARGSYRLSDGENPWVTRVDSQTSGLPVNLSVGDEIEFTSVGSFSGVETGTPYEVIEVESYRFRIEAPAGAIDFDGRFTIEVTWRPVSDDSYEPGETAPGEYDISDSNPAVVSLRGGGEIDVSLSNGDEIFFERLDEAGIDLISRTFTVQNVDTSAGTFELEDVDRESEEPARGRWAMAQPFRDAEDMGDARVYAYRVAAVSDATGEESTASPFIGQTMNDLGILNSINTVSWPKHEDASLYLVYKADNGVFGYIGTTERTRFEDENITPDLSDTPQVLRNPFEGEGNWPKTGTFFEQRLWLANTKNRPSGVWASQTTEARNFNVSRPARDDDAITFSVRGTQITSIEALLPTENLTMLTASGEWVVRGSQVDEVLTPRNLILRQRAFRGSANVPPLLVGDTALHIQREGNSVRDFRIGREVESTEISLLARHLFDFQQVREWAYSQAPDGVVWLIREDGKLLSLTYLLEHEIWGWTQHDIGGEDAVAESVACVPEGGVDAVYVTVRRTINGHNRRYVHRLSMTEPATAQDAFHVDAGLRYEGPPTRRLFGLDHLEGETLVGVFDGNVVRDLVVENGRVELDVEFEKGTIGLPYTGRVETLDLDLGPMQDAGSVLGRYKSIAEVVVRVVRTRGIFVGHGEETDLVEHRQRRTEDWDEPIELFTGDIVITPSPDWTTAGWMAIEQRDPLPATITGVITEWEFGE